MVAGSLGLPVYHTVVTHPTAPLDWNCIDTVLLDMDGTLLDLRFDNWFWQEHLPQLWAERERVPVAEALRLEAAGVIADAHYDQGRFAEAEKSYQQVLAFNITDAKLKARYQDRLATALYRQADLLVVPSQQETFGQVAAEAQACGLPVVALAESGVGSVVQHQRSGYLLPQFTPEALQQGLRWLLEDPQRRRVLSRQASQQAAERFHPQQVAALHLHLYRDLVAGGGL